MNIHNRAFDSAIKHRAALGLSPWTLRRHPVYSVRIRCQSPHNPNGIKKLMSSEASAWGFNVQLS